jgi:hypothetical protein
MKLPSGEESLQPHWWLARNLDTYNTSDRKGYRQWFSPILEVSINYAVFFLFFASS